MADSMALIYGSETESRAAENAGSRDRKSRIVEYLSMCAACLAIAFVFFIMLDQLLLSSEAVSVQTAFVEGSSPDGSMEQVKAWVQQSRQEADTIEFIEWSPVREIKDAGFSVRARYLAHNPSGNIAVGNNVFFLDHHGNVINVWTLIR